MKCTLYDLGCPNEALQGELFCNYHQKEMAYGEIIHKVTSRWTEEDRNNCEGREQNWQGDYLA